MKETLKEKIAGTCFLVSILAGAVGAGVCICNYPKPTQAMLKERTRLEKSYRYDDKRKLKEINDRIRDYHTGRWGFALVSIIMGAAIGASLSEEISSDHSDRFRDGYNDDNDYNTKSYPGDMTRGMPG